MTSGISNSITSKLYEFEFRAVSCVGDCGGGNLALWKELGTSISKMRSWHKLSTILVECEKKTQRQNPPSYYPTQHTTATAITKYSKQEEAPTTANFDDLTKSLFNLMNTTVLNKQHSEKIPYK
ncbi:hypothetical protein PR048_016725, partial [Dryococelus australis]